MLSKHQNDNFQKTIAFLPSHPSQLWVMYEIAQTFKSKYRVIWVLRNKDVIVALARHLNLEHIIISEAATGFIGNLWEMLLNIFRCLRLSQIQKIDVWITQYGPGNIAAWLTGGKSICPNDDDIDNAPLATLATYPFCDLILTPEPIRVGIYEYKRKKYHASHELFYLHSNRFKPDASILSELGLRKNQRFAILRLVSLTSNHDSGVRGASKSLVLSVIELAKKNKIHIFITSEKKMDPDLEEYKISLPVHRIHHALACAEFFVGDSQSMTSEAAVLGTPAFRINDFVGKISMIEEWEKRGMAFGYLPEEEKQLLADLEKLLKQPNHKNKFLQKRKQLLTDMIDPVPYFCQKISAL